jgi:hypothetical protein
VPKKRNTSLSTVSNQDISVRECPKLPFLLTTYGSNLLFGQCLRWARHSQQTRQRCRSDKGRGMVYYATVLHLIDPAETSHCPTRGTENVPNWRSSPSFPLATMEHFLRPTTLQHLQIEIRYLVHRVQQRTVPIISGAPELSPSRQCGVLYWFAIVPRSLPVTTKQGGTEYLLL